MDLRDLEHNARDGLHIASLAGAWIALIAGFGGLRDHDGQLSFRPQLPTDISRLAFALRWRGTTVHVDDHPVRGHLHAAGRGVDRTAPRRRDVHASAPSRCAVRPVHVKPLTPTPTQPVGPRADPALSVYLLAYAWPTGPPERPPRTLIMSRPPAHVRPHARSDAT